MYDEGEVIWTSEDGNQRIRAVRDNDPMQPYFYGAMPTLQVDKGFHTTVSLVRGEDMGNLSGDDLEHAYREFDQRFGGYSYTRDMPDVDDVFFRWLRIFHGTTTTYEYGPNQGTDYHYLVFDTEEWRKAHEIGTTELSARDDFSEWRCWIEGDTYGIIHEVKVKLHVTKESVAFPNRPWEDTETDEWDEEDAVWGFYTDDMDDLAKNALWQFCLDKE